MDVNYRAILREAQAEPSPHNIIKVAQSGLRMGIFTPVQRPGRRADPRNIKLAPAAALVHLAARGGVNFEDLRADYRTRNVFLVKKFLAQAVLGGVPREDLATVLSALGLNMPVGMWSPDGVGFGEMIGPQNYSFSSRQPEITQFCIVYQNPEDPAEISARHLISIARLQFQWNEDDDEDDNPRLMEYEFAASEDFTLDDIEEGDIQGIVRDWATGFEPREEEEIRSDILTPLGLARIAYYISSNRGIDENLRLSTPSEVRQQFVLEIAMKARGWL